MSRGHREEDVVYRYSINKIIAYANDAARRDCVDIAISARSLRAAFHADQKEFEKFTKRLLK